MFRVAWKKVENKLSDNRKTKMNICNPLRYLPDSVKVFRSSSGYLKTCKMHFIQFQNFNEFLRKRQEGVKGDMVG